MKAQKIKFLLAVPIALIFSAIAIFITGCEASSPNEMEIKISPNYLEMRVGQSVELTASGWHAYKWSISGSGSNSLNNTLGILSARTGTKVSFRALGAGRQTVWAEAADLSGSGTNSAKIVSGTAIIDIK